MKKKLITAVLAATSLTLSNLDLRAQKGFAIGVEGTPHMSWMLNQDDSDNNSYKKENTFGASFGISSQFGFNENMGIGLNVLYSLQGQKYTIDNIERNNKMEYLKIPLMFVYNSSANESNMMIIAKIGPQMDVLVNANLTDKDGNSVISERKKSYEDFVIGGVASLGMGYKVSDNFMIDASLRYDFAFTDSEKTGFKAQMNNPDKPINSNGTPTRDAITNNSSAGITIGFRFIFGE